MRINTKIRYAVRMMVEMAKYGYGSPVAMHDVAGRSSLPKMYLSQLAAPLKSAGLIKSYWGNRGGYVLNRPASQISLLEIIEAVDGPIALLDCVADSKMCKRSRSCEAIDVWRAINDTIVTTLRRYSLADLIRKRKPLAGKEEAGHRLSRGGRRA